MSRYRRPLFWKSGRRRTPMAMVTVRRPLFSGKLEKVADGTTTWPQIISCRGTVGHFCRRPGGPGAGRGPGAPPQKSGRRRAPIGAGRRPLFLIRVKSGRRQDAIMTSPTSGFRHTKKIIGAYRRPLCKKKVADVPAIKVFRGNWRAAVWGSGWLDVASRLAADRLHLTTLSC